jgi:hypothetical protein
VDVCQKAHYGIGTDLIFRFAMTIERCSRVGYLSERSEGTSRKESQESQVRQSGGEKRMRVEIYLEGASVRFSPTAISGSSARMSREHRVFLGCRTSVAKLVSGE